MRTLEVVDTLVFGAIAAALSAAGLFLTVRRGRARGRSRRWWLRGIGLSLLPFGLWASGLARLGYRLADASVDFLTGLTFNPLVWTGFATIALAVVLLIASWRAGRTARTDAGTSTAARPAVPGAPKQVGRGTPPLDDGIEGLDEVEQILRRRGIS